MKNDCRLIATIPSLNNMEKVENVFKNENMAEVRFNTGVQTFCSIEQTLGVLSKLSKKYHKRLGIDIKGRQLRVIKWADPMYLCIEINHKVRVLNPAYVYFKNGDKVSITHVKDGNKLFVDPSPRQVIGASQSVDSMAKEIKHIGIVAKKSK